MDKMKWVLKHCKFARMVPLRPGGDRPSPESKKRKEYYDRLIQIQKELSDLHYESQHGTPDPLGKKRQNLSEEYVFLSRLIDAIDAGEKPAGGWPDLG